MSQITVTHPNFLESGDPRDEPPLALKEKVGRGELGLKTERASIRIPTPSAQETDFYRENDAVRLMVRRNFVAPPADQATPTSWRGQCPRWAVKRIFGRQSNDGYGEDSGPSRGDPRRRSFRPIRGVQGRGLLCPVYVNSSRPLRAMRSCPTAQRADQIDQGRPFTRVRRGGFARMNFGQSTEPDAPLCASVNAPEVRHVRNPEACSDPRRGRGRLQPARRNGRRSHAVTAPGSAERPD